MANGLTQGTGTATAIANAPINKSYRGTARAGIQHRHVCIQGFDKVARFIFAAIFLQGITPGGKIVPPRAT